MCLSISSNKCVSSQCMQLYQVFTFKGSIFYFVTFPFMYHQFLFSIAYSGSLSPACEVLLCGLEASFLQDSLEGHWKHSFQACPPVILTYPKNSFFFHLLGSNNSWEFFIEHIFTIFTPRIQLKQSTTLQGFLKQLDFVDRIQKTAIILTTLSCEPNSGSTGKVMLRTGQQYSPHNHLIFGLTTTVANKGTNQWQS